MLGHISFWRHFAVAIVIAGCTALAALGYIGGRIEHFDQKQITVSPLGADGIHIREVVDEDFANARRHGYQRIIPDDFGIATNVTASSPDANADVDVEQVEQGTRIRLGDPNKTFTGQHRYVLSYTLPEAKLSTNKLDLDIIGTDEDFQTDDFVVIVTGMQLADPVCSVGGTGKVGGCTLTQAGDDYRVEFKPLKTGQGITISGTITARTTPTAPPLPALPARAHDHHATVAVALVPIGLFGALVVLVFDRRRGRNEVYSGGAAEAAYGKLPEPGPDGRTPAVPTRLVSDARLRDLATTEFVPPKGLEPWQGNVLLSERIDDTTASAWLSGMVAREAITMRKEGRHLVMGTGPKAYAVSPVEAGILTTMMGGRLELQLGKYDSAVARAWTSIKNNEAAFIKTSGWWRRRPPGVRGPSSRARLVPILMLTLMAAIVITELSGGSFFNVMRFVPVALAFGFLAPTLTAVAMYFGLLPSRSATGSAQTLLTESFRRFLQASEGQHVEWAWKQGLLREYSAWAVALGAADAWGKALAHSDVPPQDHYLGDSMLVYTMSSSLSHSHTEPSSSGGGGGGGVGGGGGGGSSGSW